MIKEDHPQFDDTLQSFNSPHVPQWGYPQPYDLQSKSSTLTKRQVSAEQGSHTHQETGQCRASLRHSPRDRSVQSRAATLTKRQVSAEQGSHSHQQTGQCRAVQPLSPTDRSVQSSAATLTNRQVSAELLITQYVGCWKILWLQFWLKFII